MIDPLISLSFSLNSHKGIYALLLGSGVSRSAQIPTGWEIVLDLIRKIADLQGETCEPEPDKWFRNRLNEEASYSKLLSDLAKTADERCHLLRQYFEPSEKEREEGIKQPTIAHKSIAQLVAKGFIKVIITTNFDRLIERAIEDEGITPIVVSTSDQIKGMTPLIHQECCIIKLHGDYLDTRIKNSPEELASYDDDFNNLLDRVLDEFGLIICGWSAEWDIALRAAIERCPNRRFTTYWTHRDPLTETAQKLVYLRDASTLQIESADKFFEALALKTIALSESHSSHPLSIVAAKAMVKRFVSEERFLPQLNDLVIDESEKLFVELCRINDEYLSKECEISVLFEKYHNITEVMMTIMANGCRWASEKCQDIFAGAIQNVARNPKLEGGRQLDAAIRAYPALLLQYCGGISAIFSKKYRLLYCLLANPSLRELGEEGKFTSIYDFWKLSEIVKRFPSREREYTPACNLIYKNLLIVFRCQIPDESEFDFIFDKFEYFRSLVVADISLDRLNNIESSEKYIRAPVGRLGWKQVRPERRISQIIDKEIEALGEQWEPLKAGFFGGSLERCKKVKEGYDIFLGIVSRQWL